MSDHSEQNNKKTTPLKDLLWFIFFFPVGLYRILRNPSYGIPVKVGAASLIAFIVIAKIITPPQVKSAGVISEEYVIRKEASKKQEEKLPLGQYRLEKGYVACLNEEWLDDISKFTVSGDKDSFNAYLSSNKCVVLNDGLIVTLDKATILGSKVSFFYKGTKFWTVREAINH